MRCRLPCFFLFFKFFFLNIFFSEALGECGPAAGKPKIEQDSGVDIPEENRFLFKTELPQTGESSEAQSAHD